jgi:4a-hydroxytetrahydrobiopterin dehydratase
MLSKYATQTMSLLTQEEIEYEIERLEGWTQSGPAIEKNFDRGDFRGAVEFLGEVASTADEIGHHPDVRISWSKVTLSVTTHSEGGLTGMDFELAERIDEIA